MSTGDSAASNEAVDTVAAELQNIRLDENANQVSSQTANTVKSDANNNTVAAPDAADNKLSQNSSNSSKSSNNTTSGNNMSSAGGGNKTNHHRRYYPSRSFGAKDRQMQHQQSSRSHMNSNSNLHVPSYSNHHHQQHHPNQSSRNNNSGNNNNSNHKSIGGIGTTVTPSGYQTSTTPNSSRNVPNQHASSSLQPPHQHPHQTHGPPVQLQPPPHVSMSEHSVQTSPMCGYDDPFMISDSHNCNVSFFVVSCSYFLLFKGTLFVIFFAAIVIIPSH